MMSRTLGAILGGTTRGGQYGLDSRALSLITPPNFMGCGGICFPSIVTVALGEPGSPVMCWALAGAMGNTNSENIADAAHIAAMAPSGLIRMCAPFGTRNKLIKPGYRFDRGQHVASWPLVLCLFIGLVIHFIRRQLMHQTAIAA